MTFRAALIETHSNNGEISWMRVGCSIALLTGSFAILIQLFLAVVVSIARQDLSELAHIEWMQPITLIGVALTGKVAQKREETTKVEVK
jgi:hypothetical protein